jgi:hypothetical protein
MYLNTCVFGLSAARLGSFDPWLAIQDVERDSIHINMGGKGGEAVAAFDARLDGENVGNADVVWESLNMVFH